MFISPDGGVITNQGGYLPPDKFAPVMEETIKKEAEFKAKLAEYKKNPEDMKLNREIAILYINRQQLEKALPISKKLPDDLELNSQFALAYLNLQKLDLALLYGEKVFAKDTKNESGNVSKLHTQIGLAYAMQLQRKPSDEKLAEKAVKHLQTVIDKFPESKESESAQYYLGATYHINKQYDKAIVVLEKLLNHGKNENLLRQAEMMLKRAQDSLEAVPKNQ